MSDDGSPEDEQSGDAGERTRDGNEREGNHDGSGSDRDQPAAVSGLDDLPIDRRALLLGGGALLGGSGVAALALLDDGPGNGTGGPGGATETATPTDGFGYGGTATATATAMATATATTSGGTTETSTDAGTSSSTDTATPTPTPTETPTATATPTPTPAPDEEYGEQLYGEYSYGGDGP